MPDKEKQGQENELVAGSFQELVCKIEILEKNLNKLDENVTLSSQEVIKIKTLENWLSETNRRFADFSKESNDRFNLLEKGLSETNQKSDSEIAALKRALSEMNQRYNESYQKTNTRIDLLKTEIYEELSRGIETKMKDIEIKTNQKMTWEFDNQNSQINVFKEKLAQFKRDYNEFEKLIADNTDEIRNRVEMLKKNVMFSGTTSNQINRNNFSDNNRLNPIMQSNSNDIKRSNSNDINLSDEEIFNIKQLMDHYNSVVEKQQDEQSFKGRYNPERFDVSNAMARKTNPNLRAVFDRGPGDYWVISFSRQNSYLFIPRFNFSYQENTHYAAAMGELFNVEGYDETQRYNTIRLKDPAIIMLNDNDWELIQKGTIQLSGAEPL
jgi:hypothetical protein